MTGRKTFTRRRLGQSALAGAALLGAPLPLRDAFAQGAPANLKVCAGSRRDHAAGLGGDEPR